MKIAIVGSRTFPRLSMVQSYVLSLPKDTIVISGGAKGVDSEAAKIARDIGLEVIEFLPDLKWADTKLELTKRYYARNTLIAEACDRLVAFVDKAKGGTWNTINNAKHLGKPVEIHSILLGLKE